MQKSPIEWTQFTSNPIVWETDLADGWIQKRTWFCTKVSEGCRNCYSEAMSLGRFGAGIPFTKPWEGEVTPYVNEKELAAWVKRRKPATIFVGDMTDIFHEKVRTTDIFRVLDVIEQTPWHTYMILTKRPERMRSVMMRYNVTRPPRNLRLGVSIENQPWADKRISILLNTLAAVRFLSVEPMLSAVNLRLHNPTPDWEKGISWVIFGCESGPDRRPCDLDWVRDGVKQCRGAGVAAFVKQLSIDGRVSKKMDEWPEDLRVREYPNA